MLGPDDIVQRRFDVVLRGYDPDEVTGFLRVVAEQVGELLRDDGRRGDPTAATATGSPVPADPAADPATPRPSTERRGRHSAELGRATQRILERAEQVVDDVVASAERDAAEVRAEADRLLAEARDVRARAQREHDEVVSRRQAALDQIAQLHRYLGALLEDPSVTTEVRAPAHDEPTGTGSATSTGAGTGRDPHGSRLST